MKAGSPRWCERPAMHSDPADLLESLLAGLWQTLPGSIRAYADACWPRGTHRGLPWPESQVMVIPSQRLMYVPIAKNGCSTFKRLMVRLAGYPDGTAVSARIHEYLDFYETGLQLKDWPHADVGRFMSDPGWFRFTVLRDPLERLVSAYLEKFVRNRMEPGNRVHTSVVVSAVQGSDKPDFRAGITFREFTQYIASTPPECLDPHWRPQALCLPSRCEGLRYFSLYDITPLSAQLVDWCGFTGAIGHDNSAFGKQLGAPAPAGADTPPDELETYEAVSPQSLVEESMQDRLAAYLEQDQSGIGASPARLHGEMTVS